MSHSISGSGSSAAPSELHLLAMQLENDELRKDHYLDLVENNSFAAEKAREAAREARARAAEARETGGVFGSLSSEFGVVATVASAVAAGAVVVGSGGAAAPLLIASVALTTGSRVAAECGVDARVCAGIGAAGALAGVFAGSPGGISATAELVAGAAQVVQGGATVGQGTTGFLQGYHEGRSLEADADVTQAKGVEDEARASEDEALDELPRVAEDRARAFDRVTQMLNERSDTTRAVIAST
jgi:hypothetical protein